MNVPDSDSDSESAIYNLQSTIYNLNAKPMMIDRRTYADHYGPTTGDRIRLADTELVIRIDRDWTVYGEEAKFGGGKVIRDGMGQSPRVSRHGGSPDLVITSVVIVD